MSSHGIQSPFLLLYDTQDRDFWCFGNTCDTQTKNKKNHHTHGTQESLYSVFTLVYSGITLALLTPQNFFPYVTQLDHAAPFQTMTRDPPTCMSTVWSQPFPVPNNVLYQAYFFQICRHHPDLIIKTLSEMYVHKPGG